MLSFVILLNHNSYCNLRRVRITRLCVNRSKLQHPPQAPPGFELLKISSFKFPLPEQKLCSNAPLIFFFFFLHSNQDFLHIDQSLKPTLRRSFLLSNSSQKWTICPRRAPPYFKDWTLVFHMKDSTLPVQIAHPSKARFPNPIGHWQRSNDRGLPRGKEGGQFWS